MRKEEILITIQNVGTFSLQRGESVLSMLKRHNLLTFSHCGGNGICGNCRVRFLEGTPLPCPGDRKIFSPQELRQGWRLACLAKPQRDTKLILAPMQEKMTVLSITELGQPRQTMSQILPCVNSDNSQEKTASMVVIDLGTTTIVMQLREIGSGRIIDTYTALNPQRSFGADVVARMQKAVVGDAAQLSECVVHCLESGMEKWLRMGFTPAFAVLAGNTVMLHLLLGQDVQGLAGAPFEPVTTAEQSYDILGVETVIMPGISAFVGADIMAGILACRRDMEQDGLKSTLLVDLGTNGEMALLQGRDIFCTATAAGPAFEGGATVNVPGADMIHIAAQLLQSGCVDETGLVKDPSLRSGVTVEGVLIRQEDIRNLQLAKAAVLAGISTLLHEAKIGPQQIERVYLAGGFGYYLDVDAACLIGVLPMGLQHCVRSVGNAALAGMALYAQALADKEEAVRIRDMAAHVKETAKSINLAETGRFQELYVESMYLRPYE